MRSKRTARPFSGNSREANTTLAAANSGTGGSTNNGTYSNATLVAGPSLPGLSGQAVSFSGSNTSHVTASDAGLPSGSADRTMMVWINTTDTRSTYSDAFCYGTATAGQWFDIYADPNRDISTGAGLDAIQDTSAPINDGKWHFVAATLNAGALDLYVDGTLSATGTTTANTVLNQAVIGDWVGMASNWQGAVADVAVIGTAPDWHPNSKGSTTQRLYSHPSPQP